MVSVIIPTYNSEKYIAATLESVLAQTYRDLEVLIMNDCSRDKYKAAHASELPAALLHPDQTTDLPLQ